MLYGLLMLTFVGDIAENDFACWYRCYRFVVCLSFAFMQNCKNRLHMAYGVLVAGGDVKHYSINHCSCIVLKRQKISTGFLLHTVVPCSSTMSFPDCIDIWLASVNPFLPKFCPKVTPCWFEDQRCLMAICGQMIRYSTMITMESLIVALSNSTITDPLQSPLLPNGDPKCTPKTNFATCAATWRIW